MKNPGLISYLGFSSTSVSVYSLSPVNSVLSYNSLFPSTPMRFPFSSTLFFLLSSFSAEMKLQSSSSGAHKCCSFEVALKGSRLQKTILSASASVCEEIISGWLKSTQIFIPLAVTSVNSQERDASIFSSDYGCCIDISSACFSTF